MTIDALNRELGSMFKRWHPDLEVEEMPDAASSPGAPCSPGYRACGNSGRSNQTLSIRAFVLQILGVRIHPFTNCQRTW